MWDAARSGLRGEVESLIAGEDKRSGLLRCVSERREYPRLYPRGKHPGASPKLFALYQTDVCGRTARVLHLAQSISRRAATEIKAQELLRLQRPEAFRDPGGRNRFRRLMSELAWQGDFTLEDYLLLFPPSADERGVGVRFDGWDIIRYYLHHVDDEAISAATPDFQKRRGEPIERLAYYAGRIFETYVAERGVGRFESEVLQRSGMGSAGPKWLQRQFTRHAVQFRGFTYAAWEALCLNDAGRSCLSELLFQMRLLWAEWLKNGTAPPDGIPVAQNGSGLVNTVDVALAEMSARYVQQRGISRFHRDVLMRLQQGTIGLPWLRRQLVRPGDRGAVRISERDWEDLLLDDAGRWAPSTRLFQMHLCLANVYRHFMQNKAMTESIEEDVQ